MRLISFLFRTAPGAIIAAALASILAGLASTGVITLVNGALENRAAASGRAESFVGLCILALALTIVSQILLVRISASSLKDLRLRMGRQILAAPYRQLEQIGPARLMATLTSDVGAIAGALATLPSVVTSLTVLAACLVYLGTLSWKLLIALVIYAAVGVVLSLLPILAARRHVKLARDVQDRLFEQYRGVTEGAKELRLHRGRREGLYSRGLQSSAEAYRAHSVKANTIFELSSALGQTLLLAALGIVLFVAPRIDGMGSNVTSGYALTLLFMATPLSYTFAMMRIIVGATVSYAKIRQMGLSLTVEDRDEQAGPTSARWNRLEMQGIVGAYRGAREDESFTVGPVDLAFVPGEIVFLVGGNGSGKSTLVKVLMGLYAPEEGRLLLDGREIDDKSRDWFRQHFSAVFADFFLFRDLRSLGVADLEQSAAEYLELLQMSQKVSLVDGEFSTIDLSQGQRKRLALLGAYLEDRPIYVFDEWAADQDPVFKDLFYTKLLPDLKARGKCVVVVSHDDRYFEVADRIIRMESGRVVEGSADFGSVSAPSEVDALVPRGSLLVPS